MGAHTVTLARHAMASRFELVLHGEDAVHLRAAGEQALGEIERLENQLSLYRPQSEVANLNRRAAGEPVKVTPSLFSLLKRAKGLSAETGGAFDISIAPLVRCWGFMDGNGQMPSEKDLAEARSKVGMDLVHLDEAGCMVRFVREGVMLDLGAIGKGYAIEEAAELLREAGIASALLHGGTSSIYAIGHPPDADAWNIAIENPAMPNSPPIATIALKDESLSVSAVWGKSFKAGNRTYGHVLDPRTGQPTSAAALAALILPSATEADALSTALLTLGAEGVASLRRIRPNVRALVLFEADGRLCHVSNGIKVSDPELQER
jgi:thiamine biosynthesis lipoprotein